MDEHKKRDMQTRQIIANAERLIAEVDDALARADRMFADHNIDRGDLLAFMEKNPNAAKMMEQVQKNIAEIASEMEIKSRRVAALPVEPATTQSPQASPRLKRQHRMI